MIRFINVASNQARRYAKTPPPTDVSIRFVAVHRCQTLFQVYAADADIITRYTT